MAKFEVVVRIQLDAKSPADALDQVDVAVADMLLPGGAPYTVTIELPKRVVSDGETGSVY